MRQLAQLLKLNRQAQLAFAEEDDLPKAVALLQNERGLLSRAHQAAAMKRDVRGLDKVLMQLDKTLQRAVERIGDKIYSASVQDMRLEQYQGQLEVLLSLLQGQPNKDPLKLRRSAVEFVLQSLKHRVIDLVEEQTRGEEPEAAMDYQSAFNRQRTVKEFVEDMPGEAPERADKEIKEVLFPKDQLSAYF